LTRGKGGTHSTAQVIRKAIMAAASTRDQKLAQLDAMLSRMKVTVSSVDQRIFRMAESAGSAVYQRHMRASRDSVCRSRSSSTSTASPAESAGWYAEEADELSRLVSTTEDNPSESRCTTEQELFSVHGDDGSLAASAPADFGRASSTGSFEIRRGKRRDTELAASLLDLALGLTPAVADDRDANFVTGDWVDTDGNAVRVEVTGKTTCAVSISRPPLLQLQLNMWQTASSGWHCGDAAMDVNQSTESRLMWRFPCGRVAVWMRQKSLWDGWHEHGSWLSVWETGDGYGPWVTKAPLSDQDDSPSTYCSPSSTSVCQLDELAFFLSGGQSITMMMPQVQADGTMVLVPATELAQPQLETQNSTHNVEKADETFSFAASDFPALTK